ncbi:histidine phosphatase family protein [Legionella drancourtii]|uniref:Phosphoglycerate mutase n=1 Tax=Legionella drancourtii LLAP12 TaxID=658187 RepID=G9ELA1_9GAMM|nr:phosphoglycerate mutase family protein [Legionella drancourtii]EHL31990.1 hypothetical protein LDG_6162 [Legionella drancourtii LLAP12]
MSTLNLWLIRHGESSANAGVWNPNPASAKLTPLGREQAQKVAAKIIEQPTLIISSPLSRAHESAQYIMQDWPATATCTWPIQELIYLAPTKLQHLSLIEKKERINTYWEKSDPFYCDGEGAESFATFLQRLQQFHEQLCQQQGFVVVVGHGLFFKAYQLGLTYGFQATSEWMHLFRQQETMHPIKNSELLKLVLPL